MKECMKDFFLRTTSTGGRSTVVTEITEGIN